MLVYECCGDCSSGVSVVVFFLYKAHFLLVLAGSKCREDCSPVESCQCLFFYSSIRFNSGWFMNVVRIVPQWRQVSVYFFTLV